MSSNDLHQGISDDVTIGPKACDTLVHTACSILISVRRFSDT